MSKVGISTKDKIPFSTSFISSSVSLNPETPKEYNDVSEIARMFLADYFKGINSFDYIEEIGSVNPDYGKQILDDIFVV